MNARTTIWLHILAACTLLAMVWSRPADAQISVANVGQFHSRDAGWWEVRAVYHIAEWDPEDLSDEGYHGLYVLAGTPAGGDGPVSLVSYSVPPGCDNQGCKVQEYASECDWLTVEVELTDMDRITLHASQCEIGLNWTLEMVGPAGLLLSDELPLSLDADLLDPGIGGWTRFTIHGNAPDGFAGVVNVLRSLIPWNVRTLP